MKDKKKIVIGVLCALIMIMAVGYALLSQQLSITGSAGITSNWQVEITNIRELEKSTGATTNNTNYTATTASFNTSLTSPGDYALYEVTVTNKGTLDAVLSAEPTVTTGNNTAIQYELDGIKKGDKILKNNQTDTFTIKVQYNPSTTTQPSNLTSNIEVTLNYEQDLGQVILPRAYSTGDIITYKDATWRVIKNSSTAEEYVTLIKENVLTAAEIGDDYSIKRNGVVQSKAGYYWSDTCHTSGSYYGINTYGTDAYDSYDVSGCAGHNDYASSKIKGALDNYMNIYLDALELKEIDGYKIRLITLDELLGDLGYTMEILTNGYPKINENVPTWIYQNGSTYWTMTPTPNGDLYVVDYSSLSSQGVSSLTTNVRPVINLLKSAIEQ